MPKGKSYSLRNPPASKIEPKFGSSVKGKKFHPPKMKKYKKGKKY